MAKKKLGSIKTTDQLIMTSADLANDVSGILGTANGGTGQSTFVDGTILVGQTSGNTLAKKSISGDATMDLNGVLTIAAGAITDAKLALTYALLAGRSGGQILDGDTASGGNLTLVSTAHATKGKVFFGAGQTSAYDEVNDRLGIGLNNPTQKLAIAGDASVSGYLYAGSNSAPNNTTAGDSTFGRISIGNVAFDATDQVFNSSATTTATASGGRFAHKFVLTTAHTTNSSANNRVLQFRGVMAGTGTVSSMRGIEGAIYHEQTTGTVNTTHGAYVIALEYDVAGTMTNITTANGVTGAMFFNTLTATASGTVTNINGVHSSGQDWNAGLTATTATHYQITQPAAGTITNLLGLDVPALTRATTLNCGVRIATPSGATSNYAMQLSGTGGAAASGITFGTDTQLFRSAAGTLNTLATDAGTNTTLNVCVTGHNSSGTPAASYGCANAFQLQSSTTADQNVGRLQYLWATATHASRKARSTWSVYDTAEREGMRIEASGTAPMVGFLGTAAAVQQTGDAGTALVTFGLMSGTPTFAAANLTGAGKSINARVTADVTTTSTTQANVTGLSFAIGANENWSVEFSLYASGSVGGMTFQLTGPASPTNVLIFTMGDSTGVAAVSSDSQTAFSTPTQAYVTGAFSGVVFVRATIENGANAGTVQLQFASGITLQSNTVKRGSFMTARLET